MLLLFLWKFKAVGILGYKHIWVLCHCVVFGRGGQLKTSLVNSGTCSSSSGIFPLVGGGD